MFPAGMPRSTMRNSHDCLPSTRRAGLRSSRPATCTRMATPWLSRSAVTRSSWMVGPCSSIRPGTFPNAFRRRPSWTTTVGISKSWSPESVPPSWRRRISRFQSLVDQSIVGINIIQDGHFRYANQALAGMFGFASPEEMIDKVAFEELVAPEFRALVRETIRLRTEGVLDSSQYQFTGRRRDGSPVEVEIFGRRIEYAGGAASIGIVVDVTERQRIERERAAAVAELMVAKEAAEAANVAKSAFLANMSHEIAPLLNANTGMAYLIRRGGMTPAQSERMSKPRDRGIPLARRHQRGARSPRSKGKFALEEHEAEVEAIVALVVSLLREKADAKQLQKSTEIELPPRLLPGDATRLQQALLNYAGNAVSFTDSLGSVHCASSAPKRMLTACSSASR